ncbi:MAG: dihydroorotase [Chloroflexota bacterium]|nr:dihydroorotase [Chloroflexota bacterium]
MSALPLLITGGRICDPASGLDVVADLLVADGAIAQVRRGGEELRCEPASVLSARGRIVAPGLIDLHCHLREPGFEYKETIASGTRAAARGGFTTVCCMPNTEPPIDSRAAVQFVLERAAAAGAVRVLPIGCITRGRRGQEMVEMAELADAGCWGLSDDGDAVADARLMRYAMEYSRSLGLVLIEHCEDASLSEEGQVNEGPLSTRLGLKGIPAAAEEGVVARDIALAEMTGARLHIAHVSTAGSVDLIRRAKERGVAVTAEVTPHHLTLTEERVLGPDWGDEAAKGPKPLALSCYDTAAKVNPPLRSARDVEALRAGLKEGVIDAIATDHAPHADVDKRCEFAVSAFGISGLETALGCALSLVHSGAMDMATVLARLTSGPAAVLGRGDIGQLKVGAPADIVIIDPDAEWVVDPAAFASRGRNTPFAGYVFRGRALATVCRGEVAYRDPGVEFGEGAGAM